MINNILANNINLILYLLWIVSFISFIFLGAKNYTSTREYELKTFGIFMALMVALLAITMYAFNFGFVLLENYLANYSITNITITILSITTILLSILLINLKFKLKKLSEHIILVDQRYSINKNHVEYQRRKNSHKIYRSE